MSVTQRIGTLSLGGTPSTLCFEMTNLRIMGGSELTRLWETGSDEIGTRERDFALRNISIWCVREKKNSQEFSDEKTQEGGKEDVFVKRCF